MEAMPPTGTGVGADDARAGAGPRSAAAAATDAAAAGAGCGAPPRPPLIDLEDWAAIAAQLREQDERRETLLKRIRDAQKLSKQAVFSLHRGDGAAAARQIAEAERVARELLPLVRLQPALRFGAFAAALEEYAEACALKVFLEEGRLVSRGELPLLETEEYLGGVLDMTGELNRYAVAQATRRNVAAVAACRDVTEAVMGRMLQLDLRNGALRKKYDTLKYTLRKMENTLYELSLADAHRRAFEAEAGGGGGGGGGGGRGARGGGGAGDGGEEGTGDDPEMSQDC
ncbi:translin [Raphidocelis subcapitata]|uniref:Translin n=1 Tax=Raphidocelis subcapitata TaxID=307507 RepID=A0A2V0P1R6_9CHLO|nr:translin [Raphidocelis subcapitata]|eukprot:GBF91780.1 translin [Raphidocelis subcapitata]